MSISIYYTAVRDQPLAPEEQTTIDKLCAKYGIEDQILERERTGKGPNWESFCIYEPEDTTEPGVIFEGATKLPDNSEENIWLGLQHWCALLSEIRRSLEEATWSVDVDDLDISWDEERQEFDPSS